MLTFNLESFTGKHMNKKDLVNKIAENESISKTKAAAIVNAVLVSIQNALKDGESVQLFGFGTFKTMKRAATIGRNPQTSKKLKIPAKTVVKFKAGTKLKELVN